MAVNVDELFVNCHKVVALVFELITVSRIGRYCVDYSFAGEACFDSKGQGRGDSAEPARAWNFEALLSVYISRDFSFFVFSTGLGA